MKANELRIGNLVYFKHCDYDSTIPRKVDLVQKPNLLGLEKIAVNRIEFNHVEPIPVTEEWLLKFGFVTTQWDNFDSYRFEIGNNDYAIVIYSDGNCEVGDVITTKINYVHQLQNLYFALTSEELTFKPHTDESK